MVRQFCGKVEKKVRPYHAVGNDAQVRAGEGASEATGTVLTNPVWKTSIYSGLSTAGRAQVCPAKHLEHLLPSKLSASATPLFYRVRALWDAVTTSETGFVQDSLWKAWCARSLALHKTLWIHL